MMMHDQRRRNGVFLLMALVLLFSVLSGWMGGPAVHAAVQSFVVNSLFEAEEGVIRSPWQSVSGGTEVSGGTYLSVPANEPKQDPPTVTEELTYKVQIVHSGTYKIWFRILAPGTGSDSFFWDIEGDANPDYKNIGPQQTSTQWQWISVSASLKPGTKELRIKYREAGLGLDRLVVTSQADYEPAGIGENPYPAPIFATESLFEAEDGDVRSPWGSVAGGANVSKGYYVTVPATEPKQEPVNAARELTYKIHVQQAGTYKIWFRILAPGTGSDSFYWDIDSDDNSDFDNIGQTSTQWQWISVSPSLAAGTRELKIKYRESGLGLDRMIVTSDIGYTPTGLGVNPGQPNANLYPTPPVTPPQNEHPRLFVRESDLNGIRNRLAYGEVKDAWQRLSAAAGGSPSFTLATPAPNNTNHDTNVLKTIIAKALSYLLYEDEVHGAQAVSMMDQYLDQVIFPANNDKFTRQRGETLLFGAIVYDWCYDLDLMTPAQRNDFNEHFESIASGMEVGYPPTKQGAIVGHGAEAQILRDLLSVGVAVYDQNTDFYNLAAGRIFAEFIEPREYVYAAHAHHQGDSYGPYRYQWDLFASWIFKRMGVGADGVFDEAQRMTPYEWLYARRPDGQLMRDGDTYKSFDFGFGKYWTERLANMLPAAYYNDPYLKNEFLRQYNYNNGSEVDLWMILFSNPYQSTESEASLPLTKYFAEPKGQMIARTGWSGGLQSSAVIAMMKVGGTWFANHQHLDAGQFQLYYKGGLAIDSGIYQGSVGGYNSLHDVNYYKRTIAHNSMLVYDTSETFPGAVNDGGQRIVGGSTIDNSEQATIGELLVPEDNHDFEVAEVVKHQFGPDSVTPDYSYLKGDLTKAYHPSKMEDYKRSFVFLNLKNNEHPAALVVFDKVTAKNGSFKKTWLLHSENEPNKVEDTVTLQRTDKGYNGKLVNRTLLPASNVSIVPVGGLNNEFSVNGFNYNQGPADVNKNSEEAGAWRVEVSPDPGNATDLFLNVMQVMDAVGGPAAPLVTESIASADMVGVKIDDRAVLFAKSGEALTGPVSFELPASVDDTRVLVTDLSAGYWTVTKTGNPATVQYAVTAEAGTLYFEADSGGTYTLNRSQVRTLPAAPVMETLPVPQVAEPITMLVNGANFAYNNELALANNQVILPYGRLVNALQLNSNLQGSALMLSRGGTTIQMTVASNAITINGQAATLKTPVSLRNGTVYVPLEVAALAGWATVKWDDFVRKATVVTIQ